MTTPSHESKKFRTLAEFKEAYFPQSEVKAVVVDDDEEGEGQLALEVIELLRRELAARTGQPRKRGA